MGFDLSTGCQVLPNTKCIDPSRICYWQGVAGPLADGYCFNMTFFSLVMVAWKRGGHDRCTHGFTLSTNQACEQKTRRWVHPSRC